MRVLPWLRALLLGIVLLVSQQAQAVDCLLAVLDAKTHVVWQYGARSSGTYERYGMGVELPPEDSIPRLIVYSRTAPVAYIATTKGVIYSLRVRADRSWAPLPEGMLQTGMDRIFDMALSPDGAWMDVLGGSGSHLLLQRFPVQSPQPSAGGNPGGWLLPAVDGPIVMSGNPSQLAWSPRGDLLYVLDAGAQHQPGSLRTYLPDRGSLRPFGQALPVGINPQRLLVAPDDSVYVLNAGDGSSTLSQFRRIDGAGAGYPRLAPLTEHPLDIVGQAEDMAFSADASQLYIAHSSAPYLTHYLRQPGGTLQLLPIHQAIFSEVTPLVWLVVTPRAIFAIALRGFKRWLVCIPLDPLSGDALTPSPVTLLGLGEIGFPLAWHPD